MAERPKDKAAPRARAPSPRKVPDADGVRRNAKFSQAMVELICEQLVGGMSLQAISRQPGMPSYSTLHNWKKTKPGVAEAFAASREGGAEFCLDRALAVAQAATKESVSRDRLEVDTWLGRAKYNQAQADKAAPAAAGKTDRVEIVFYARQFEKVIGPDGRAVVREVPRKEGEP